MQIKRQQKHSLASPPPKKKGASRTNQINGQKPILSTVPKKQSKSKVNLGSGVAGGQSNSCTAKKTTLSSSKFDKGGHKGYLN